MIIIPNLTWFYLHVLLASIILYKDYDGTLEESLNRFEQSIGLYTPPDTTEIEYIEPPFYVPPLEQDSTGRRDSFRTAELILWDSPNSVIQIKQDLNQSQDWFTPLAIQIWDSRLVAKQRELS
jgi:hypothetical protein